jgi:hypothetical protein
MDIQAIENSLFLENKPYRVISGESSLEMTGGYVRFRVNPETVNTMKNKVFLLSAHEYNLRKTTPYRLPRDISLTVTDIPESLMIE